jgi:DNA-binding MarR family transcriptional regulator/N-acetylglutamate synthase-like GNAT family acetyltransferase
MPQAQHVEDIRRFNRFYTKRIGVLQEGLLSSAFSLAEGRVLYELAQHEETTATHLANELTLDAGYLSRILANFQKRRLVRKQRGTVDARQSMLSLTETGRQAFAKLNAASKADIERLLGELAHDDQQRLVRSMQTIEQVLTAAPEHKVPYILRPHQPGDMGWVVQRHGVLYNREYGWNEEFEALVAEIVATFLRKFDAKRERCWIAEKDGENVGCVFLVKHPERKTVAKLRCLLVEPSARGLGIGKRLVSECTRFARQAGYSKITLWTNDVLTAARHLYENEGYKLVKEGKHHAFGRDLVEQTWELSVIGV